MGIQSSVNSLLSQAQSLAAFYKGFEKAGDIIKGQEITKNEAQIQTEIASGNAPMKDGKVDPEWLQKRRRADAYSEILFYPNGKLSTVGKEKAEILQDKIKGGREFKLGDIGFYTDSRVQEYLKSFNENTAAKVLANKRVIDRTDSINQTKSNFDEHVASLIKKYGKGSGNP